MADYTKYVIKVGDNYVYWNVDRYEIGPHYFGTEIYESFESASRAIEQIAQNYSYLPYKSMVIKAWEITERKG